MHIKMWLMIVSFMVGVIGISLLKGAVGEVRHEITIEGSEDEARQKCLSAARGRPIGFLRDSAGKKWKCTFQGTSP